MKKVFVDANTYIDYFYGRRNVHLKDLQDFEKALGKNDFELICPQTTKDEVLRQFPQKTWKNIKVALLNGEELPNDIGKWPPYEEAMKKLIDSNSALGKAMEQLDDYLQDILENHVEKIMKYAEEEIIDEQIIKKAEKRRFLGNPPGKRKDAHGDEIAWEIILDKYSNEDVVIITGDEDWGSIENEKIKLFLEREWKKTNSTNTISLSSSIRSFLEPKQKKQKEEAKLTQSQEGVTFNVPVITSWQGSMPSTLNHPAYFQSYFAPDNGRVVECTNCHNRFQLPNSFFMGAVPYTFSCPNCGMSNSAF